MQSKESITFPTDYTPEQAQAILDRLKSAVATPGEMIRPYQDVISDQLLEDMISARYALLASGFFSGKIPQAQRREVGRGLSLVMSRQAGMSGNIYFLLEGTDIGETVEDWTDLLDRIGMWLKHLGGITTGGFTLPLDIIMACAIIIYYRLNPPAPPCPVGADTRDKWRHCYVGCKLAFWIPNGLPFATLLAALKEIADVLGLGNAEFEDFVESMRGVSTCGFFQSCEDCCCEKGY